jgi:hypothetical protein
VTRGQAGRAESNERCRVGRSVGWMGRAGVRAHLARWSVRPWHYICIYILIINFGESDPYFTLTHRLSLHRWINLQCFRFVAISAALLAPVTVHPSPPPHALVLGTMPSPPSFPDFSSRRRPPASAYTWSSSLPASSSPALVTGHGGNVLASSLVIRLTSTMQEEKRRKTGMRPFLTRRLQRSFFWTLCLAAEKHEDLMRSL